jgi:EAL domain-containing protein (putative c-di-GMP-specific phosphodiesterase class I)
MVSVAINVSAEQFAQPDFVQTVERILQQYSLSPDLLELENTESLMLSDFELTTQHLAELKRLGVGLALDDFGTGHAALANLQRFPIDTIKIDRSFMQDFVFPDQQTTQALDLLQTIVILAQKLHMCTVVEGIETDHQAVIAHRIGSERAQGYWFAKPVPAEACTALLQENQRQLHNSKAC